MIETTFEDLLKMPIAEGIRKALEILQKLQEILYTPVEGEKDGGLIALKIGTVLTFKVLKKISGGVMPAEFSTEDWMEIAESVSDYAVLKDGRDYTVFVFGLYADYIRWSASLFKGRIDPQKVEAIFALADELKAKTNDLGSGAVSEPQYVEDCLWICLEAMVKLLSTLIYLHADAHVGDVVQAAVMLSFEYGRLMQYAKEQALLEEYAKKQYQLDEELNVKLAAYKAELESDSDKFKVFISKAFAPGFRDSFRASVELALAAGVREEEILRNLDDIDMFFL